ncbi:MAG: hypothetical protein ACYDHE_21125 [Candidatus Acidiferrales bacterium]
MANTVITVGPQLQSQLAVAHYLHIDHARVAAVHRQEVTLETLEPQLLE